MKFVIYKDKSDEFRWQLVATNGNIVADGSEGYKNKADLVETVESIKNWLVNVDLSEYNLNVE